MDDEGEEFRSSTVPNTRRCIVTKTSLEEDNSDEKTVAVTTQESLDGICEKAMRIARIDELGAKQQCRKIVQFKEGAENNRNKKASEIVKAIVGSIMNEVDIVTMSDSKPKLWKDMSLKRAIENWNMEHVNVARNPGSALRVFTSSERLARSWRIGDEDRDECSRNLKIGEEERDVKFGVVEKLVRKVESGGPHAGKMMRKVGTGDRKVVDLVKQIQTNDPKVGRVWKLARFGQAVISGGDFLELI